MKRAVILKINLPTGTGKARCLRGQRIKVCDADYARLVPRFAHDADEYLAADADRKAAYNKTNPDKIKAFRAAQEARYASLKEAVEAEAEAKKIADAREKKAVARRLAKIEANEEAARKADALAKKQADSGDGPK